MGSNISCSVVDTNAVTLALTGNKNRLIKYFSTAFAEMSASLDEGCPTTLTKLRISNGNRFGEGAAPEFEYEFPNVEHSTFEFRAYESNGYYTAKTVSCSMVEYVKLTCNVVDSRPDASGKITLSCKGRYFNGSFGSVSNYIAVYYQYRVKGGSWSPSAAMTVTKAGNTYTASAVLEGLDTTSVYDFSFTAYDQLMTASADALNVRSVPLFHWGEDDVTFEVPVVFKRGAAGAVETGMWTPSLSCTDATYSTHRGWYTKTGNVVTAGFYLLATCPSGWNGENVVISGLPYHVAFRSSGGGICSGVFMSGNYNFQGFSVKTDNTIVVRVQSCDSTVGNLVTTEAGCKYPLSGGQIALSGTITYLTS